MFRYCDKILTIERINGSNNYGNYYTVKENMWNFKDWMIKEKVITQLELF